MEHEAEETRAEDREEEARVPGPEGEDDEPMRGVREAWEDVEETPPDAA